MKPNKTEQLNSLHQMSDFSHGPSTECIPKLANRGVTVTMLFCSGDMSTDMDSSLSYSQGYG